MAWLGQSWACGWSYANKLEKDARKSRAASKPRSESAPQPRRRQATAPPKGPQNRPAVVEKVVPNARSLVALERNHRVSAAARSPSDMAQHAFRVRLVDAVNDATRLIHCTTGKVVKVAQRPPAPGLLDERTRAGVPPGVWVLQIDPTGQRADLPNNDWYRHISKFHHLEYIDRSRLDNTIIYRYAGHRQAPAPSSPSASPAASRPVRVIR